MLPDARDQHLQGLRGQGLKGRSGLGAVGRENPTFIDVNALTPRAYRLYEERACNLSSLLQFMELEVSVSSLAKGSLPVLKQF